MSVSPDGKWVLEVSEESVVSFRRVNDKTARSHVIAHFCSSAHFSSDSKTIITIGNTIQIFPLPVVSHVLPIKSTGKMCVAGASYGSLLIATGTIDGIVYIVESDTKKELHALHGHTSRIRVLSFTRNNAILVAASCDTVIAWDVLTGCVIWVYKDLEYIAEVGKPDAKVYGGISRLLIDISGSRIIIASSFNNVCKVCSMRDGSVITTLCAYAKSAEDSEELHSPFTAALSPNGRLLVTTTLNNTSVWDVSTGLLRFTMTKDGRSPIERTVKYYEVNEISSSSFSSDGCCLMLNFVDYGYWSGPKMTILYPIQCAYAASVVVMLEDTLGAFGVSDEYFNRMIASYTGMLL